MHILHLEEWDVVVLMGAQHQQCLAGLAHSCSPANAVDEGSGVCGGVVLDDVAHVWDIQPTSGNVCANQRTGTGSRGEAVVHLFPLVLLHLPVECIDRHWGVGQQDLQCHLKELNGCAGQEINNALVRLRQAPQLVHQLVHLGRLRHEHVRVPKGGRYCRPVYVLLHHTTCRIRGIVVTLGHGTGLHLHSDHLCIPQTGTSQLLDLLRLRGREQPCPALSGQV
mmetsp:Transcript_48883/g.87141  ORF Transcript_48883/g.87141 Transcript_48883/m.87141 type:complete len:223 (+) Transcript_48883:1837-2505(+)